MYEHPQFQQWVEESRRKIAFALHNLGDDLEPSSTSRRGSFHDASTREDDSPDAVERRRRARQDILERGRMMEERRRSQQPRNAKSKSFDDLVDEGGNLKPEVTRAKTSAAEPKLEQQGIRNRHSEISKTTAKMPFADQYTEEARFEDFSTSTILPTSALTLRSRSSSTATLPSSPAPPPVPPKEPLIAPSPAVASRNTQPSLLIDTDDVSNHPSEALVDLTPTTSASSVTGDLSELEHQSHPLNHSQSNFWSVHEWAENNSAPTQFYTPPRSEAAFGESDGHVEERSSHGDERSETGSGERVSRIGSMSDMGVMSENGDISTPGSWSEVGSRISEDF